MTARKGIILAGGSGTRLYPITKGISKQLIPVYDKPMIYYPLSVLMLMGLREIAIITTPQDQDQFQRLLGDGSQWGLELSWIVQPSPDGLAQAYILAEDFLDGAASTMVLGDNIFFGDRLSEILQSAGAQTSGGTIFGYQVTDPGRYGVITFDETGTKAVALTEKPEVPASDFAITGLYCLDGKAPERARTVQPSARGEIEITDLLEIYLNEGSLTVETMSRGYAWFDTGTHASMQDAGNFVRTVQDRQGLTIASPEEIAFRMGWIDREQLLEHARELGKSDYGTSLKRLAEGR